VVADERSAPDDDVAAELGRGADDRGGADDAPFANAGRGRDVGGRMHDRDRLDTRGRESHDDGAPVALSRADDGGDGAGVLEPRHRQAVHLGPDAVAVVRLEQAGDVEARRGRVLDHLGREAARPDDIQRAPRHPDRSSARSRSWSS
jgi:hypothetical protein